MLAMLDHITIEVVDFPKSRAFYGTVLLELGYHSQFGESGVVGFGKEHPMFWVAQSDDTHPISQAVHMAFIAENEDQVQRFYETALAQGAKDNGTPGLRPEYGENYFAAFVIDLNGHNIEALISRH